MLTIAGWSRRCAQLSSAQLSSAQLSSAQLSWRYRSRSAIPCQPGGPERPAQAAYSSAGAHRVLQVSPTGSRLTVRL